MGLYQSTNGTFGLMTHPNESDMNPRFRSRDSDTHKYTDTLLFLFFLPHGNVLSLNPCVNHMLYLIFAYFNANNILPYVFGVEYDLGLFLTFFCDIHSGFLILSSFPGKDIDPTL